METSDRESILLQIDETEKQITKLQQQQNAAEKTLQSLRERLAAYGDEHAVQDNIPSKTTLPTTSNLTAEERVSLFARIFRGRDDVYPKLWESQKTGRKGYTPDCANEWVHGVCEKSQVKCKDCPNRALLPVTDDVVLDHLLGAPYHRDLPHAERRNMLVSRC